MAGEIKTNSDLVDAVVAAVKPYAAEIAAKVASDTDVSWENRGDVFAAALLRDQAAQQAANNANIEGGRES